MSCPCGELLCVVCELSGQCSAVAKPDRAPAGAQGAVCACPACGCGARGGAGGRAGAPREVRAHAAQELAHQLVALAGHPRLLLDRLWRRGKKEGGEGGAGRGLAALRRQASAAVRGPPWAAQPVVYLGVHAQQSRYQCTRAGLGKVVGARERRDARAEPQSLSRSGRWLRSPALMVRPPARPPPARPPAARTRTLSSAHRAELGLRDPQLELGLPLLLDLGQVGGQEVLQVVGDLRGGNLAGNLGIMGSWNPPPGIGEPAPSAPQAARRRAGDPRRLEGWNAEGATQRLPTGCIPRQQEPACRAWHGMP